jgi:hypothetical protein
VTTFLRKSAKGGNIYFGSWFQRFQSTVDWSFAVGPEAREWQKHMVEENSSPQGGQEAQTER